MGSTNSYMLCILLISSTNLTNNAEVSVVKMTQGVCLQYFKRQNPWLRER